MLRRIVVVLVISGVAAPLANVSAAQASVGLPIMCASRNVNSLYWKHHCWTADEVWYPYFAKTGTWNVYGVKAATSMAHRRVSLWAKPPGKDWRRLAARELDSNGRAKASWKAPSSVTREWRFQWRSPYRDYVSPKLKVDIYAKACGSNPRHCEY
jgi:hypothetical protein